MFMREQFRSMEQQRENQILLDKMLLIMNRPNKLPGAKAAYTSQKSMDKQSGGPMMPIMPQKRIRAGSTKAGRRRKNTNTNSIGKIEKTHDQIIEEEVGNIQSSKAQRTKILEAFGVDGDEIIQKSDARQFNNLLADYRIIRKNKNKQNKVTMFHPKKFTRNREANKSFSSFNRSYVSPSRMSSG